MTRWLLGFIGSCALLGALAIGSPRAKAEYPQYLFIQPNSGGYPQLNPAFNNFGASSTFGSDWQ